MKSSPRLRWLWPLLLVWPLLYACDQLIGVNPCNKLCDDDGQCGAGYTCLAGRCGGDKCGTTLTDAGSSGSTSSGNSSGGTSNGSGSSAGGSSGHSSSQGSSGGASSGGPLDGGPQDAGPADAAFPGCRVNGVPVTEGTVCGVHKFCNATGTCTLGCLVGTSVFPSGADPTNSCRRCAPSTNDMAWTNNPDSTLCTGTGGSACTAFRCHAGACEEQPRCLGTTPLCAADAGTCACVTSPSDSCAAGLNDHVCRSGTCGCNDTTDCAGAHVCGPAHTCVPCSSVATCGLDCTPCRATPQSLGEGSYYTCSGNNLPSSVACVPVACSATTANCDNDDTNQCEADLTSNPLHCAACGLACGSGACVASQCTCTAAGQCPAGQTCPASACECAGSTDCPADAGYHCSNRVCVR